MGLQTLRHHAATRSRHLVQEPTEKLHWLMERPLLRVRDPLHRFKDATKNDGIPWSHCSRKEQTSLELHWEVQQRSCSGKRYWRDNEAVPHCKRSARRHRREESCMLGSPKDPQRVPSDREDLHSIWRRVVCGQPQQIREGGTYCWILQKALPGEKEGRQSNLWRQMTHGHFTEYTPLVMSRERSLAEIAVADLTEVGVKPPKAPSQERKWVDKTKYCRFHKCHRHTTDDCIHLKDSIELLIQRGRLKQFIKNPEAERKTVELIGDGTEASKTVAMSVEHLGDFPDNVEITPYSCTWEQFPSANVITGGTLDISIGSMKRKFEELMSVNLLAPSNHGGRPPLAFYDSELPSGASNSVIPLLVRASMANTDVCRVLIDTGASCDIKYTGLFKTLQLTKKNLSPYVGNELYGFNGSSTQP